MADQKHHVILPKKRVMIVGEMECDLHGETSHFLYYSHCTTHTDPKTGLPQRYVVTRHRCQLCYRDKKKEGHRLWGHYIIPLEAWNDIMYKLTNSESDE